MSVLYLSEILFATLVDCPTQLTVVIRIGQFCTMTNTSEEYERTQQGNLLLPHALLLWWTMCEFIDQSVAVDKMQR